MRCRISTVLLEMLLNCAFRDMVWFIVLFMKTAMQFLDFSEQITYLLHSIFLKSVHTVFLVLIATHVVTVVACVHTYEKL